MPRRKRQREQHLVFHERFDAERLGCLDRVRSLGIVGFVLRLSAQHHEQRAGDPHVVIEAAQAALALQLKRTGYPEQEQRTVALVTRTAELEIEAALRVDQDIFEALQAGDRDTAAQFLPAARKLEGIDYSGCRHKARMIVFPGTRVKDCGSKRSNYAGTYSKPGMGPALVLASSSAYRRALLERLRLSFAVAAPHVDEAPLTGETPEATALRLSEWKARAVGAASPGALVIGSDQVASLDGRPVGKPGNHEAALAQLRAMRGRPVEFHTALCLLDTRSGAVQLENVPTLVQFRDFTDEQAERYLRIDQPYDCAGSAKVEALGIALLARVESADPTALIGLPLIALVRMLEDAGVRVP